MSCLIQIQLSEARTGVNIVTLRAHSHRDPWQPHLYQVMMAVQRFAGSGLPPASAIA
jgi:hypothetical protein